MSEKTIDKLQVGDKLWLVRLEGHGKVSWMRSVAVRKVGRKYFYVADTFFHSDVRFRLSDFKEASLYFSYYRLYRSKGDYLKQVKRSRQAKEIATATFVTWKHLNDADLSMVHHLMLRAKKKQEE